MTERSTQPTPKSAVEDTSVRPLRDMRAAAAGTVTADDSAPVASSATTTAPVETTPPPIPFVPAPPPPVKAAKPPKPPKPVKPSKPTREEKRAARAAEVKPSRRARLRLTRIDPWSVMKTSFLLAIAFGIVTIVSVTMVWSVLGAAGVWTSINDAVQNIIGGQDAKNFDIQDYLGTQRVVGFTMIVSVVDVVLFTAIGTLAAFLYNMAAALLGGVEVTLAEDN